MNRLKNIPENYQTVMPYLILENAKGFIEFATTVFQAIELQVIKRDLEFIMHAELKIGDSTLMLSDATEQYPIRNSGLFIYVEDADHTVDLAIQSGATLLSPLTNQPYGRSGGITDPFGNQWWVTTPVTPTP